MDKNIIRLLYLFRDHLVKSLYDMSKQDNMTTNILIEHTYQKLTAMIDELDKKTK